MDLASIGVLTFLIVLCAGNFWILHSRIDDLEDKLNEKDREAKTQAYMDKLAKLDKEREDQLNQARELIKSKRKSAQS